MRRVLFVLRTLLYEWLLALVALLRLLFRRGRRDERSGRDRRAARTPCVPIDRPEFVRPDPLLYSQRYLMEKGLAVTWDNPDVQLRRNGVAVPSSTLDPATTYDVVARIWNNSMVAPVIAMPVHFSYLDFGAGTVSVPIGSATVDVGVKGGPGHPAFATVTWTTPATPGHYCLQVLLDPVDDLEYKNNLGQENTNVGVAQSPATFEFTLRNDTRRAQRYHFEVDAYVLGDPDPCDETAQHDDRRKKHSTRHRRGTHPLPPGWAVVIEPETPSLQPDEEVLVKVTATPPDGFVGTQQINVNAFNLDGFAGGVTLTVVAQ